VNLSIEALLAYDFPAPCEVLLLIEAAHSPDQTVLSEALSITPLGGFARLDDPETGERRCVFQAQGRMQISYRAEVEVAQRTADLAAIPPTAIRHLPHDALPYLRASRYCPSDRFESFVEREFGRLQGGDRVAAILQWIGQHLDYRMGVSDASTTALDTFVDRAGVCRDYTHLMLSLCRASSIPARAVSAYAWKLQPPDMHAVAEVWLGGRWRLIDATGLAPIEGMIRVATGRDAADIAFMTIFGRANLVSQSFSIAART
jgi:transglutaminase-like putative cysteine protease